MNKTRTIYDAIDLDLMHEPIEIDQYPKQDIIIKRKKKKKKNK